MANGDKADTFLILKKLEILERKVDMLTEMMVNSRTQPKTQEPVMKSKSSAAYLDEEDERMEADKILNDDDGFFDDEF